MKEIISNRILAFEVANFSLTAALLQESGEICKTNRTAMRRGHDAELVPILQSLLDKSGYDWKDLTAVITTTGPGSFTGVRVGLAVAKALELAATYPLIGLNSYDFVYKAFALDHVVPDRLMVALESGREDQYVQLYEEERPLGAPFCVKPEDLFERIPSSTSPLLCIGNGAGAFKEIQNCEVNIFLHDACHLARIGESILIDNETHLYPLDAYYVRPADVTIKEPVTG
jgi:tRNA threonylcarbamoyladenosine biosynthesis protein TsaB